MGLIDFVKNVGRKLDHQADNKPQQHPQGQHPQNPAAAQQAQAQKATAVRDVAQAQERTRETALANLVNQMGFKVRDLAVDIEGDKALIRGAVDSQADREKIILMVGNTEGIGSVDDRLQVSRQEPESQLYDVKPGDTLSKIAKQFYGDANKYQQIFEANRPMLKDPDEIYPGQKLRIPAMATAAAGARA
ncbi:MAG TPA: peptidoglycan-binding protein LysM [Thermoanaerobaculia bacterium]|jgi:nucleoid-associated protein YgaU|nr:peptidoglycan-binding protein LysM [Thermoanaerobaculia bacterium]